MSFIDGFYSPSSSPHFHLRIPSLLLPRVYNPKFVEELSADSRRKLELGVPLLSFTNSQLIRISKILDPTLKIEINPKVRKEILKKIAIEEEAGGKFSLEDVEEILLNFQYSQRRGDLLLLVEMLAVTNSK